MRRVGILHFSGPPVIGGVEFIIEAHSRCFLRQGYGVRIIVGSGKKFHPKVKLSLIPELDGLHPQNRRIRKELDEGNLTPTFGRFKENIKRKLKRAISDTDVVIIHNLLSVHFNLPATAALHETIESSTKQFIFWCHDITPTDPNYCVGDLKTYPWSLLKKPISNIRYVTISSLRQSGLSKLLSLPRSSITVVPDGVEETFFFSLNEKMKSLIDKYSLFDADCVMLFPARVIKRKNIELGIEVVSRLQKMGKIVYFVITGPPDPHNVVSVEYYKSLKRLTKRLGIEHNVIFLYEEGLKVDSQTLKGLYKISDILFLPSTREGFGLPLLEAGLVKLPIFTSKIEPITELGENDVNYFALNEDPEKIAFKIVKFLSKNGASKLFRKVVMKYRWGKIFKEKIEPLINGEVL